MYDQFFYRSQTLEKFSQRISSKSVHDLRFPFASLRCFRLVSGRRGCVWISDGVAISVQESERVVVKVLVTRLSDFVSSGRKYKRKKKEERVIVKRIVLITNMHIHIRMLRPREYT